MEFFVRLLVVVFAMVVLSLVFVVMMTMLVVPFMTLVKSLVVLTGWVDCVWGSLSEDIVH